MCKTCMVQLLTQRLPHACMQCIAIPWQLTNISISSMHFYNCKKPLEFDPHLYVQHANFTSICLYVQTNGVKCLGQDLQIKGCVNNLVDYMKQYVHSP